MTRYNAHRRDTNHAEKDRITVADYKHFLRTGELPHDQLPEPPRPSTADTKREAELQKLCELELSRRDIAYLHLSPKAREKKGWPDLVFAMPARPIAVELKTETGQLSEDQVQMLTQMKANGWEVYVIRKLETFIDILNGYRVEQWAVNEEVKPAQNKPEKSC